MTVAKFVLTFMTPVVALLLYGLRQGYRHRSKMNELRKSGMSMAEDWTWLTGHLHVLSKQSAHLPPDAFVELASRDYARGFTKSNAYLMDYWPIYPPMLHVFSPKLANQVSTQYNLPKLSVTADVMEPISGGPNLVVMNGHEWKKWRGVFNPGFAPSSMLDLVPDMVESINVFCNLLREKSSQGIVRLDDLATRLTMDVILRMTLKADVNHQRADHKLALALRKILAWNSFWDPRIRWHPLRPLVQWYYSRILNAEIRQELDREFAKYRQSQQKSAETVSNPRRRQAKSVVNLALEAYIADNLGGDATKYEKVDDVFIQYAICQIRIFLFAGKDTTASTLVWTYHMLHKHPTALSRMREEHDRVFGSDSSQAASILRDRPALINQCPFTMAVIKETLRLYSPAASTRQGSPGLSLTDHDGTCYPLDSICVNIDHPAMHFNPRFWPRAAEFLPDRWLVTDPGHELYPVVGAFRPFEIGPRNCLGQTLALNELRVALIMTVREFEIRPAYEELDLMRAQEVARQWRPWKKANAINTVDGDRAYQTDTAGAHPSDGYPCRVALRNTG